MAVTPLTLPTTDFFKVSLEPDHLIATTYARGGYSSEITEADPIWGGVLTTTALTPRTLRAWETFISEATSRMLPFDFVHPMHLCPGSYAPGALPGGWGGLADLASVSDLRNLTMAGLPVGLILLRGDRLSVAQGDYVSYRMVAEDLTVASNTSQVVPVTPRLPLGRFTVGADVSFAPAKARLRVVKNTWSAPLTGGQEIRGSFEVMEATR